MLDKRKPNATEKLQIILRRLEEQPVRCLDVETSGLEWHKNHIVGYVVCFGPRPDDSYYVPFRHAGTANVGGQPGPTTAENWNGKLARGEKELVTALDRQGTIVFGHNLSFDLKFLHRVGYTMQPRFEDTIINAPLLNEHQGKFSLEECAVKAKVQYKKSKEIIDHIQKQFSEVKDPKTAMGHFWRLAGDDPVAVGYAEGDGTTTWQLRETQMQEIVKPGLGSAPSLEKVWDVECRLIPVLARMSLKGIKIDTQRYSTVAMYIKAEMERLLNKLPKDFNPRSSIDVRFLMEKNWHTDWPTTKPSKLYPNGQPSFVQGWLDQYPAGRQIIQIRKLTTLRDSFMVPLMQSHQIKGRVHTNFNQLKNDEYGTVTGRLSSNNPNMQAVPKHDEEIGRLFRSIFIPDHGLIWGAVDYSQCEPRLLAEYSNCKVLIDGYNSDPPVDAHTAVAEKANRRWASMSPSEQKQYRNDYAKRINQTILTGGGKKVLVQKYKLPEEEVDKVWDDYHLAMPEIKKTQQAMQHVMRNRGYIHTLLGRRCRLIDDRAFTGLNRALQGGNADILKLKLVEVDEYLESEGRPLDLLLNCHDAVDFQFDEGARPHFNECQRIMTDFSPGQVIQINRVPITLDVGEGPNWAIATYGEEKGE